MRAAILGVDYHLPARVETNEQLQRENPDWRIDEIFAKSGIRSRHVASADETASDLGYLAATKLLQRNLIPLEEIDYLLYCTQSPDYFLPSGACVLQQRLKLGKHIGAFDFNLGCSGFVYGLQLAKALITSGAARNVLLITADTYTKYIHARDRTVRTLFGDGAAATLVGPAKGVGGIGDFVVGTDGKGAEKLIVPQGAFRQPTAHVPPAETTDAAGCTRTSENLFMDGPAIFTFAISTIPKVVAELIQRASLTIESVNKFVFHQANQYMLDQLQKRSAIPPEKMLIDVLDTGNTVSASIPLALQRAVQRDEIHSNDQLVLVGFGVGYSWAACNLVWD